MHKAAFRYSDAMLGPTAGMSDGGDDRRRPRPARPPRAPRAALRTSEQTRARMNGAALNGRRGAGAGEGVCGAAGAGRGGVRGSGLGARKAGPRRPSSRAASAGRPVRGRPAAPWRRRSGRSPLHNPAAAALRTPQAARPRGDSRGARPARLPAPPRPPALGRLRAARVRSRPSPHPAAGRGRSPSTLPRTTMPGAAASSGLAGPGAPRRRTVRLPGPGGGPGKESHRRAAVHARPTLSEGGPARSAADPAPPPRRARAAASPRPLRPDPGSAPAPPPAGGGRLSARSRRGPPRLTRTHSRAAHAPAAARPGATRNAGS